MFDLERKIFLKKIFNPRIDNGAPIAWDELSKDARNQALLLMKGISHGIWDQQTYVKFCELAAASRVKKSSKPAADSRPSRAAGILGQLNKQLDRLIDAFSPATTDTVRTDAHCHSKPGSKLPVNAKVTEDPGSSPLTPALEIGKSNGQSLLQAQSVKLECEPPIATRFKHATGVDTIYDADNEATEIPTPLAAKNKASTANANKIDNAGSSSTGSTLAYILRDCLGDTVKDILAKNPSILGQIEKMISPYYQSCTHWHEIPELTRVAISFTVFSLIKQSFKDQRIPPLGGLEIVPLFELSSKGGAKRGLELSSKCILNGADVALNSKNDHIHTIIHPGTKPALTTAGEDQEIHQPRAYALIRANEPSNLGASKQYESLELSKDQLDDGFATSKGILHKEVHIDSSWSASNPLPDELQNADTMDSTSASSVNNGSSHTTTRRTQQGNPVRANKVGKSGAQKNVPPVASDGYPCGRGHTVLTASPASPDPGCEWCSHWFRCPAWPSCGPGHPFCICNSTRQRLTSRASKPGIALQEIEAREEGGESKHDDLAQNIALPALKAHVLRQSNADAFSPPYTSDEKEGNSGHESNVSPSGNIEVGESHDGDAVPLSSTKDAVAKQSARLAIRLGSQGSEKTQDTVSTNGVFLSPGLKALEPMSKGSTDGAMFGSAHGE
ncbi:hypothetical protein SCAR479_08605 [Seiridium cardinale]|uniref:Uncharacterized protein n=1 Tax=Seiridium cardinale TaxID=138064 RepID=A0ABR2XM85_9PEZI